MRENSKIPISRLKELRVKKLFGRFNYSLKFAVEENVSILIAPNGFGKTAILRAINSFTDGSFNDLSSLDFQAFEFYFSSGIGIKVTKDNKEHDFEENESSSRGDLLIELITLSEESAKPYTYRPDRSQKLYRFMERRLPVHRLGFNKWLDARTDEVLTTEQVRQKYEDTIPNSALRLTNVPDWLESTINHTRSHLIETQRLLSVPEEQTEGEVHQSRRKKSISVVEKHSRDLRRRIRSAVTRYALEAQNLDPTFPRRIIEARTRVIEEESEIKRRLSSLAKLRSELVDAGLITESEVDPLSDTDDLSDENTRRILAVYISDTERKLKVFSDLNMKVKLFKEILNSRFEFTEIWIDQSQGILALDRESRNAIPLSKLSSGEQHEIVLLYELLFVVTEGTLILIDEPEISLHVDWQRRFVSDIQKIQEVMSLQFILATHSPQIFADHLNLVQGLKYDGLD